MTRKQFRHDMRRGLGSCLLKMELSNKTEDYREDVLWGLQYALAYDAQCEGTRAIYFHDMISLFDDQTAFYEFVADGAKRSIKNDAWRFSHFMGILALMARDGHTPARQAMTGLYELLLQAIRTGKTSANRIWSATDNFGFLCVETLTIAIQTRAECEAFFLRVLRDYGKLIQERHDISFRFEDDGFEHEAAECLGKERVEALLTAAKGDPDIARYLENRNRIKAAREINQATRLSELKEQTETETAQSIYEKLCAGEPVSVFILNRIVRKRGIEDAVKLGRLYAKEERDDLREGILQLFFMGDSVSALGEEELARLMHDAESEKESLREKALRVISKARGECVRSFALRRIKQRPRDGDAILMLLNNFRPGDGTRLIRLVKSVSLNEYYGDWHSVFSAVRDLIEQNPEADRELSAALLPYMLREGFCSCCRLHLLQLMQPRRLLTPELIEECSRDCNLEIREFIGKIEGI